MCEQNQPENSLLKDYNIRPSMMDSRSLTNWKAFELKIKDLNPGFTRYILAVCSMDHRLWSFIVRYRDQIISFQIEL